MITRAVLRVGRPLQAPSVHALTAALLAMLTLAAASAEVRPGAATGTPVAAVADDGMPGKGLPPSPGPTDPNESVP